MWDPAVGSTGFEEFCAALAKPLGHGGAAQIRFVDYDAETETIALPGGLNVPKVVYNYAQYIKEVSLLALPAYGCSPSDRQNFVSQCPDGMSVDDVGSHSHHSVVKECS